MISCATIGPLIPYTSSNYLLSCIGVNEGGKDCPAGGAAGGSRRGDMGAT